MRPTQPEMLLLLTMMMMMMKSVEFDDDVALLLSVAGLVMGPHVTSESEIGGTDSAALRISWRRIPAVEHSGRGATQLAVQIKRRRRLMWRGEGAYSSTHILRCKHLIPVHGKTPRQPVKVAADRHTANDPICLRTSLICYVLNADQWRPYRWCKWCGAPGPTTLGGPPARTR